MTLELIADDYCAHKSLFFSLRTQNQTRGLMGNWTFDVRDDFTLPNGREGPIFNADTMRDTYDNFARECKNFINSNTKFMRQFVNFFRGRARQGDGWDRKVSLHSQQWNVLQLVLRQEFRTGIR